MSRPRPAAEVSLLWFFFVSLIIKRIERGEEIAEKYRKRERIYEYVLTFNLNIQGVTGGTYQTSGGCSLC